MFEWSSDWLTSQNGKLTGKTSVKSKSSSPSPTVKQSFSNFVKPQRIAKLLVFQPCTWRHGIAVGLLHLSKKGDAVG